MPTLGPTEQAIVNQYASTGWNGMFIWWPLVIAIGSLAVAILILIVAYINRKPLKRWLYNWLKD